MGETTHWVFSAIVFFLHDIQLFLKPPLAIHALKPFRCRRIILVVLQTSYSFILVYEIVCWKGAIFFRGWTNNQTSFCRIYFSKIFLSSTPWVCFGLSSGFSNCFYWHFIFLMAFPFFPVQSLFFLVCNKWWISKIVYRMSPSFSLLVGTGEFTSRILLGIQSSTPTEGVELFEGPGLKRVGEDAEGRWYLKNLCCFSLFFCRTFWILV